MGEIVNLNRFRKQKAKETRERDADANRIRFGRSKAEKKLAESEKALADKSLDGHKIDE
ncbi:MAG: DUF4169 family protein [Rhizobiales bacterium]|nr:DUF4169 family protein [Hyphomicrobiales bacterium]